MRRIIQYFDEIKPGKIILWCYLIWYLVVVYFYFDPLPKVWMNAIGISAVIGTALMLSVSSVKNYEHDHWQTFRLYLMPFCVSSFSALIKEQSFIVVIPPNLQEISIAVSCCVLFMMAIATIKFIKRRIV